MADQTQQTPPSSPPPASQQPPVASQAAAASPSTQPSPPSSPSTPPTPSPERSSKDNGAKPDWLGAEYYDAGTGPKWDDFGKHYAELATRDAAEQIRRNTLPKTADDVRLDLPKDFKLPTGVSEYKLDMSLPEIAMLKDLVVKRGLDADTTSELIALNAAREIREQEAFRAAQTAEMSKLGTNATQRITSLQTFFKGLLGEDDAQALNTAMYGSRIVEAMERLATKYSSGGAAPFSQAHREPITAPGKVTEEQFQAMTASERLDYVRSHNKTAH